MEQDEEQQDEEQQDEEQQDEEESVESVSLSAFGFSVAFSGIIFVLLLSLFEFLRSRRSLRFAYQVGRGSVRSVCWRVYWSSCACCADGLLDGCVDERAAQRLRPRSYSPRLRLPALASVAVPGVGSARD